MGQEKKKGGVDRGDGATATHGGVTNASRSDQIKSNAFHGLPRTRRLASRRKKYIPPTELGAT